VGKGTNASWTGNWALSASYKQVKHISLPPASPGGSNWTTIGDGWGSSFSGSYDGGSYTISNLTINRPSNNYQGLFGYISGSGAIVKNVGLVNCNVSGDGNVGGVVGYNYQGTVENCYATGNVSGSGNGVGGVVGKSYGTVENCYATGNVSGSGNYVGGVVGYSYQGMVKNCYATGNVSGSGDVGGVVGENGETLYMSTVQNCYATGNVSGSFSVGGVVGYNEGISTVENCFATGNVSGSNINVGGVVGLIDSNGSVKNCFATGNVSGSGNSGYDGGVVGYNSGTVENCYATGNVSSTSSSSNYFGGVAGYNTKMVKYCIALNPNITTYSANFGRVLYYGGGSTMTNNYGRTDMKKNSAVTTWTSNANGQDGADITDTQWNSATWWTGTATFSSTVWDISNNKLPTLKNMPGNPVQNPVVQPLP
jgi:hypothetical protein